MSRLDGVSVLLLSWNGREHLATCLEALAAQEPPGVPWEILVLDNGSRDGTADWLRREHPGVRLHESPENVGFCRGNLRLAGAARYGALALLNNDMRPRPGWLGTLVESLGTAPADVAAVSGLIVDWEGERLDFGRGLLTFDGHAFQLDFRRPLGAARIPAPCEELPFACGGNMLVRREAFFAAGAFDPDYFAYFEDVDLAALWSSERCGAPGAVRLSSRDATSTPRNYNRGLLFERNALYLYNNSIRVWSALRTISHLLSARNLLVEERRGETSRSIRMPPARRVAQALRRWRERTRGSRRAGVAARRRDLPGGPAGAPPVRALSTGSGMGARPSGSRAGSVASSGTPFPAQLDATARSAGRSRAPPRSRRLLRPLPPLPRPTYPGVRLSPAASGPLPAGSPCRGPAREIMVR